MDTAVITAIVGSLSALLGASLGAIIQLRLAAENHRFQFQIDSAKRHSETEKEEIANHKQRLLNVHIAISKIARDFSITALDINLRSGMTDLEYDKRYFESCEKLDEIRAVCDLYIPDTSKHLEKMYGQMNKFWGNFKEILRLTELNEPYEKKKYFQSEAIAAAAEIGSCAGEAKVRLSGQIEKYRE